MNQEMRLLLARVVAYSECGNCDKALEAALGMQALDGEQREQNARERLAKWTAEGSTF